VKKNELQMSVFTIDTIKIHYILWSVVGCSARNYSGGFVFVRGLLGTRLKTLRLESRKVFCLDRSKLKTVHFSGLPDELSKELFH
jgi:hypothetical protein